MISRPLKLIYVHIPKTAGTSITSSIEDFENSNFPLNSYKTFLLEKVSNFWHNYFYSKSEALFCHSTALEIKNSIGEKNWNTFSKFAFVRNPWDRLVSVYHYYRQGGNKDNIDLAISSKIPSNFTTFVEKMYEISGLFPEDRISTHLKSQKSFIFDKDDKLMVDKVFRFENLYEDFQRMCDIFNLNISLPHQRKSSHNNYETYYNKILKNKVEELYSEDIEIFGYNF